MKVIRSGSAAFRSVVENHPPRTKISHELEKGIDMFSDSLGAMV
jgi:hypothetical protein